VPRFARPVPLLSFSLYSERFHLMYQNPTVLSSETHRETRLAPLTGFGFASGMNSAILAGREVLEAAKDYPVVFARSEKDGIVMVAILGVRDGSNLFIDPSGNWEQDRYIPALFRRYPFVLAELPGVEEGRLTVCVDAAYPGFGGEEGELLFDDEGKATATMRHAVEFLTEFQQEHLRTRALIGLLERHGLFTEITASFSFPNGEKCGFEHLLAVDEKKLMGLDDEALLGLVRSGGLAWIYAHLVSLTNFRDLMKRESERSIASLDS
jgi:hypothetical protein